MKRASPSATRTCSGEDVPRSSRPRFRRSSTRRGRNASGCRAVRRRRVAEGKVFFVGAGPGDPGLITVRGKQLIDSADAVVYDALANSVLLPPRARETGRPALYYVGKRGGAKNPVTQQEINEPLVTLARSGQRVVRPKGG